MSHRSIVAVALLSCALSACSGEEPTSPTSTASVPSGQSLTINADGTVPGLSIANTGPDASEYPWRRDVHLTIRQTAGAESTVAVTVLNETQLPVVVSNGSSRLKVGLPTESLVLPAEGTLTITSPLLYSEELRGLTLELAYTLVVSSPSLSGRDFHLRVRVPL
jgi:hypothetical protein